MKWLIALAFVLTLLAGPADANLNSIIDESKPELVERYILLSCDALKATAKFQYALLRRAYEDLEVCREYSKTSDYKYKTLMCLYVEMQWQFMYEHLMSVLAAGDLMCDAKGTRKNPEYEIHF